MVDPVRYKPIPIDWQSGPGVFMEDVPDGHWVKYDEHKKIVDYFQSKVDWLEGALKEAHKERDACMRS